MLRAGLGVEKSLAQACDYVPDRSWWASKHVGGRSGELKRAQENSGVNQMLNEMGRLSHKPTTRSCEDMIKLYTGKQQEILISFVSLLSNMAQLNEVGEDRLQDQESSVKRRLRRDRYRSS
jgi:hypothetical protein